MIHRLLCWFGHHEYCLDIEHASIHYKDRFLCKYCFKEIENISNFYNGEVIK